MIEVIRLDGTREIARELVGGKAWSINRIRSLGLPTPPAFTLTTDVGRLFLAAGGVLPPGVDAALADGLQWLETESGRRLGDQERPLLVSVRSGAAASMPGMMDTILNLGITDEVVDAIGTEHGAGYAADLRQSFIAQYRRMVAADGPVGTPFDQLRAATAAVFSSWMSARAVAYRSYQGLDAAAATAVTIQTMVFGNLDDESGTGVLFTRNPLTGVPEPYGEWLPKHQGEDIVSGRVDPLVIARLNDVLPKIFEELIAAGQILEADAKDMQDIEYTIEANRLWILQTRSAKRSAAAAVRVAADLAREGIIGIDEIRRRVRADDVRALLSRRVDPEGATRAAVLARGVAASPGIASGLVVSDCDVAETMASQGLDVVLARPTTDPDDVQGMIAAAAVVTELGGSTSHSAVVSRELRHPAVVGCGSGTVDALLGRVVTVDGGAGVIYDGALAIDEPALSSPELAELCRHAAVTTPAELIELLN